MREVCYVPALALLPSHYFEYRVANKTISGVFNYDVGLMPYRRPINIVVGKPILIKQHKNPDAAYVDRIHAEYTEELLRIWEEWKDTFARTRVSELEIVE
jgi:2-acylglycerol O-acyltransferase 2